MISVMNESDDFKKLQIKHKIALRYIRQKTNQLLDVMGTLPLLPDDIKDETLLEIDPIGIISDTFAQIIENLKEKNKDLQDSYDEIEAIINSTPAGILIIDPEDFVIINANQSSAEILGFPIGEIIGKRCCEFFCLDGQHICPVISNQQWINKAEKKLINASRQELTVIKTVRSLMLQNKMVIIESFIDITELKKMQDELFKAKKFESLSVFAGGIAHDFNNILTAILGNISLVLKVIEKKDIQAYERLKSAERAGLRAQGLARQLLSFAKGGAPVFMATSIIDLIKETLNFVLISKDAKITYDLPDDIPFVEIDEGQISQVFQNLAINAYEARPHDLQIYISIQKVNNIFNREGDYLKIIFRDNGPGIPHDIKERIFDPFLTTKKLGSGLGLATVYSIISKHDGFISVDNYPNGGAEFTIYLPIKEHPKNIVTKEQASSQSLDLEAGKKRILAMDDDELIRELLFEMIDLLGYEVVIVTKGEEALSTYKSYMERAIPFDLVILDLTINTGMSGIDTIKKLKEIDPLVKAIVSSGHDITESQYRELGFSGAIKKPFTFDRLKIILNELI